MDRGTWQAAVHGVTKSQMPLSDAHFHYIHTTTYKIGNWQTPTVYSTGKSTQYSVITFMGKESVKAWIR